MNQCTTGNLVVARQINGAAVADRQIAEDGRCNQPEDIGDLLGFFWGHAGILGAAGNLEDLLKQRAKLFAVDKVEHIKFSGEVCAFAVRQGDIILALNFHELFQ